MPANVICNYRRDNMRKFILLVFFTFSIFPLLGQTPVLETSNQLLSSNINAYVTEFAKQYQNLTLNDLILKYGNPISINTIVVSNNFSKINDILYTLSFNKFTINILYIGCLRTYLFRSASFTNKDIFSLWGLSIDSTNSDFEKVFGESFYSSNVIIVNFDKSKAVKITIFNLE
jgi:hypothetical protein